MQQLPSITGQGPLLGTSPPSLPLSCPSQEHALRHRTSGAAARSAPERGPPECGPPRGLPSLLHFPCHLPIPSFSVTVTCECGPGEGYFISGSSAPFLPPLPTNSVQLLHNPWVGRGSGIKSNHPAACWQRPRTKFLNSGQQVGPLGVGTGAASIPAATKGRCSRQPSSFYIRGLGLRSGAIITLLGLDTGRRKK